MKASALVRLKFPSDTHLEIVFEALEPEVRKPLTKRSTVFLEKEKNFLVLKIKASDTVALRATANAYLRWINAIKKVLKALDIIGQNTLEAS
jgi:tRNA threonylcarbamoyladenosine modification (KEOPS) complex  Pcc1 subunit